METGLPLNVYRGPQRLMVATTAPGLEPQNIRIELEGRRLSIRGAMRGAGQARKQGYMSEWRVGPYQRAVDLPESVDASRANASYDNGVLVVIFPLSPQPISGSITLLKVGTAKGQRIQHVGRDLRPR